MAKKNNNLSTATNNVGTKKKVAKKPSQRPTTIQTTEGTAEIDGGDVDEVPPELRTAAEGGASDADKVDDAKAAAKAATRATSGHAYALLAAYGEAQRTGGKVDEALRFCVERFPAAIRKAAVKLAMTKEAPKGACADALKALHDSLPAVERSGGVGGGSDRVLETRKLKVFRPKTGSPYLPCKLPPKLAALDYCNVEVSEDGTKITITGVPKVKPAAVVVDVKDEQKAAA